MLEILAGIFLTLFIVAVFFLNQENIYMISFVITFSTFIYFILNSDFEI